MDIKGTKTSLVVPKLWGMAFQSMCILVTTAMLSGAQLALAEQVEDGCMQDAAGFALNCTANDVQIAGVAKNPDGTDQLEILDDGCAYPGDTVTFTATFDVVVTAKDRHDVGIYFATDGDPNGDGAVSGSCNVSTLPYTPAPEWLDLDGTTDPFPGTNIISNIQDTCGDIDKPDHNPLHPTVTLTALCIDPDQDGFLNLPNCTSWRQAGANELCTGPEDAFPGAPSKCRCDDAFQLPITVPKAKLEVVKTVEPNAIDEPGESVTFSIDVTNKGIDPNNKVELSSLSDSIYGDITTNGHDGITETTCTVPQKICPNVPDVNCLSGEFTGTYSCTFTANVTGNSGDSETDIVSASGIDDRGNPMSGEDDATVTISDVTPNITVTKTANPTTVLEPGGSVTFSILITNNSVSSDPVEITSLTDDIYGDLNGKGSCEVPKTLAGSGGTYSCSFTVDVTGNSPDTETDTVTASGADDEGNPVSNSDSATVTILNVPSKIELIKTADPTSLHEPGGNVTYTYTINNLSSVDMVTITSLTDNILGNLNGQGTCSVPQVLEADDSAPGGTDSYTCMVIAPVAGDAGDSVTNTAMANGVDDDGFPVTASDSATVSIDNVPPAASLTKTVTSVLVTYRVEVCNESDVESLTLNALSDDIYGDLDGKGNCHVPQELMPAGETGSCYSCSFSAATTTSPTTDIVTGTVNDNDGSPSATPSDSATVSFE